MITVLNRHQLTWVLLTLMTGVSGCSAGLITDDSLPIAILILLNAIIVTFMCSRIEHLTVRKGYRALAQKEVSPLQDYVYLKAERYWFAAAILLLAVGFVATMVTSNIVLSVIIATTAWVVVSVGMWKSYEATVYEELGGNA